MMSKTAAILGSLSHLQKEKKHSDKRTEIRAQNLQHKGMLQQTNYFFPHANTRFREASWHHLVSWLISKATVCVRVSVCVGLPRESDVHNSDVSPISLYALKLDECSNFCFFFNNCKNIFYIFLFFTRFKHKYRCFNKCNKNVKKIQFNDWLRRVWVSDYQLPLITFTGDGHIK